jgi:signal peptidase I
MSLRNKIIVAAGAVLMFVCLGGLIIFRSYFLRAVKVPTGAMANTIVPGDHLFTKRFLGEVNRGDIIIFAYPEQPSIRYVSRVVGLPGETIQMQGTSVYVNGQPIPEQRVFVKYPYDYEFGVLDEISTESSGPYQVFYYQRGEEFTPTVAVEMKFGIAEPFRILPEQYFVMGDNRDNSLDSRFKGTVPRELIWGKPTMIYWSSHADQSHQEQVKWDRIGKVVK